MQAVAQLIDQLTVQLIDVQHESGTTLADREVITPSLSDPPRWSTSPLCDSGDDVDEDEAYFLGEEDDDDDDDFDDDVNLDEEDF